jgi:hypothetical protein
MVTRGEDFMYTFLDPTSPSYFKQVAAKLFVPASSSSSSSLKYGTNAVSRSGMRK